jgi:hypothetical protein
VSGSARFAERGLYWRSAVDRLLSDHFVDRIGVSNEIFALLMLKLWDRNFADARLDYIV